MPCTSSKIVHKAIIGRFKARKALVHCAQFVGVLRRFGCCGSGADLLQPEATKTGAAHLIHTLYIDHWVIVVHHPGRLARLHDLVSRTGHAVDINPGHVRHRLLCLLHSLHALHVLRCRRSIIGIKVVWHPARLIGVSIGHFDRLPSLQLSFISRFGGGKSVHGLCICR